MFNQNIMSADHGGEFISATAATTIATTGCQLQAFGRYVVFGKRRRNARYMACHARQHKE